MNIWSGKLLSEVQFGHVIIIGGLVKPNPIKYVFNAMAGIKANMNQ